MPNGNGKIKEIRGDCGVVKNVTSSDPDPAGYPDEMMYNDSTTTGLRVEDEVNFKINKTELGYIATNLVKIGTQVPQGSGPG